MYIAIPDIVWKIRRNCECFDDRIHQRSLCSYSGNHREDTSTGKSSGGQDDMIRTLIAVENKENTCGDESQPNKRGDDQV